MKAGKKQEKNKPSRWKKGESGNPATQFKKGESGNPNGRPKGLRNFSSEWEDLVEAINKKLAKGEEPTEFSLAQVIMTIITSKQSTPAEKLRAVEMVLDRVEGKPLQKTEQEGAMELVITYNTDDKE